MKKLLFLLILVLSLFSTLLLSYSISKTMITGVIGFKQKDKSLEGEQMVEAEKDQKFILPVILLRLLY